MVEMPCEGLRDSASWEQECFVLKPPMILKNLNLPLNHFTEAHLNLKKAHTQSTKCFLHSTRRHIFALAWNPVVQIKFQSPNVPKICIKKQHAWMYTWHQVSLDIQNKHIPDRLSTQKNTHSGLNTSLPCNPHIHQKNRIWKTTESEVCSLYKHGEQHKTKSLITEKVIHQ